MSAGIVQNPSSITNVQILKMLVLASDLGVQRLPQRRPEEEETDAPNWPNAANFETLCAERKFHNFEIEIHGDRIRSSD